MTKLDITLKECDRCKQQLYIIRAKDGREIATDAHSGQEHDCWDLPADQELLVLDD